MAVVLPVKQSQSTFLDIPGVSVVKNLSAMQETGAQFLGQEDLLEEGMATHSSILAQKSPWTQEPGRLQSTGWRRVVHDRSDAAAANNILTSNVKFTGVLRVSNFENFKYSRRTWPFTQFQKDRARETKHLTTDTSESRLGKPKARIQETV